MKIKFPEKFTVLPLSELKKYEKNPNVHPERQIEKIADSIQEFGFNNPILVDRKKGIIAGHGRYEAAQEIGLKKVPVIFLDHLTDAKKKAYLLADNKIADDSSLDKGLVSEILTELNAEEDIDLDAIGFSEKELEYLIVYENESNVINESYKREKEKKYKISLHTVHIEVSDKNLIEKLKRLSSFIWNNPEENKKINNSILQKIEALLDEIFFEGMI